METFRSAGLLTRAALAFLLFCLLTTAAVGKLAVHNSITVIMSNIEIFI